jgi:hydrogenase nickel incorporation protein HypA/HybF
MPYTVLPAMHEFSLADDIVKVASEEAHNAGIARLDKIILRVGDLSGVSIDALEFAFGFLREENKITEHAELEIERIPGRGICKSCGKEVELEHLFLYCPYCETPTVEITEGREFLIVSLEGEEST